MRGNLQAVQIAIDRYFGVGGWGRRCPSLSLSCFFEEWGYEICWSPKCRYMIVCVCYIWMFVCYVCVCVSVICNFCVLALFFILSIFLIIYMYIILCLFIFLYLPIINMYQVIKKNSCYSLAKYLLHEMCTVVSYWLLTF